MKLRVVGFYRILFGLLGLSAILTEIIVLHGRGAFHPGNFFSYFTILSNLAAAVWLLAGSQRLWFLRGAVTLYMLMTGVIFAVLLAPIEDAVLTAVPWDNIVLHYIMPVVLVADWFLVPPKSRVAFRHSLYWLAFPCIYVAYSLIRGSITGWYPYPFLNPDPYGYGRIAVTVLILLVGVFAGCWVLCRAARAGTTDYV
jgi:hypothetical protein